MIPWTNVLARQREQERWLKEIEQNYRTSVTSMPAERADRWQWRVIHALCRWLVAVGCRLQTRVETARRIAHPPQAVVETNSQSAQPCQ